MYKYAVVLFNLGGPDSLKAVEPFLNNLFQDPDIFKIPFGQKLFAKMISSRRAPKIVEEYKLIGGKSPINEWTEKQRSLLERLLAETHPGTEVFTAMRYWHPLTEAVVKKVSRHDYDKIILLPLYPHYSVTTTGSSFNEWKRHYTDDLSKLVFISEYYTHPSYIAAINNRIDEGINRFPEEVRKDVHLVFSAHGTPVSLVKKGDPYSRHIKASVAAVIKGRNDSRGHSLCYQSKVGPVTWLEPSTSDMIKTLSADGKKNLLVIPISFVSDHVETLFELNIEYRHVAESAGIENYIVMEGLNDTPLFINALSELVLPHMNG